MRVDDGVLIRIVLPMYCSHMYRTPICHPLHSAESSLSLLISLYSWSARRTDYYEEFKDRPRGLRLATSYLMLLVVLGVPAGIDYGLVFDLNHRKCALAAVPALGGLVRLDPFACGHRLEQGVYKSGYHGIDAERWSEP